MVLERVVLHAKMCSGAIGSGFFPILQLLESDCLTRDLFFF